MTEPMATAQQTTQQAKQRSTPPRRGIPNWLVLLACCGCTAGSIGICLNAVGVFYTPVTTALGFSRGAFALHATITSVTTGLLSPAAAYLFQRWSTRALMTTGVLLAVLATAAMSVADTLWLFYVLGFLRGVGCTLFSSTPVTMIIGHWFKRRHGFAIGLVFSFSGIAGAMFSPWFSHLIAQIGWRQTYLVMAICLVAVSLPGGLLLRMMPHREAAGGDLPEPVDARAASGQGSAPGDEIAAPVAGAHVPFPVFNVQFLLTGLFIMLCVSITGVAQHFPGYAENIGLSAQFGATMLSAAMIGNIVFKLTIGLLSDRMGPVKASTTMGLVNVTSLSLLLVFGRNSGAAGLYLLAFLYGAIYSLAAVGTPLIIRHLYGNEHYATAFGYAGALVSIGGAISLTTIGYLYDWTGSYQIALLVAIVSGIIGLTLLQVIHRMHRVGWRRGVVS